MFAFIVHSPLTKAKPALGLPLILIPITTRNEGFALIMPRLRPPSMLLFSLRLRNVPWISTLGKENSLDSNRDFILDGLQNGFKLMKEPDVSGIAGYDAVNYTTATSCDEFKPELDELFAKELNLGRISLMPSVVSLKRFRKKVPPYYWLQSSTGKLP